MSPESSGLTRRDLLKFGAPTAVFLGAYAAAPELINFIYHNSKESRQPHLKTIAEFAPVRLGMHPHKNSISTIREPTAFGILGFFPTWQQATTDQEKERVLQRALAKKEPILTQLAE